MYSVYVLLRFHSHGRWREINWISSYAPFKLHESASRLPICAYRIFMT